MALRRIPAEFAGVVDAARREFARLEPDAGAELLLYGSVATGQARVGASDVDLVTAGIDQAAAAELGAGLTARFAGVCRGVGVAALPADGHLGAGDEAYGNRVFLRHYCVPLFGPDLLRGQREYQGDAAAARGFNGDIAQRLQVWRSAEPGPALGVGLARKTLLAVAGLVSITEGCWTTDRETAAHSWARHRPALREDLALLLSWADQTAVDSDDELERIRSVDGPLQAIVDDFATLIGLWG